MKAITFSAFINAYTLQVSAHRLGVDLRTSERSPAFPIEYQGMENDIDWLLFTEESSLVRALRGEFKARFLPEHFPLELLDDKWALAAWLAAEGKLTGGLRQWSIEETDKLAFPCLVKAKHSWRESVKLPRGWICRSREDVDRCLQEIHGEGFAMTSFFIQEWLGDEVCRVVSCCGFHDCHDNARNLVAIVERIASHTKGLSCSSAVETIQDKWGLREKTAAILDALDFVGPFELEFLVVNGRVAVLELNPRFWMQHAIFLVRGNGIVKRYFGIETENDRQQKTIDDIVWADGLHLVKSLVTLRWPFVSLLLKKFREGHREILIWPSISMAIYVWLRIGWNRVWLLSRKAFSHVRLAKSHGA